MKSNQITIYRRGCHQGWLWIGMMIAFFFYHHSFAQNAAIDRSKVSSWLYQKCIASDRAKAKHAKAMQQSTQHYELVLIKTSDQDSTIRKKGGVVVCEFPTAYAAFVPLDSVGSFSRSCKVIKISANPMPELCLDSIPNLTRVNDVWEDSQLRLPQAFTGEGVVSGIMDVGFDFTHPTFRNADGTSRIKWFWDLFTNSESNELGHIYAESDDILYAQHSTDALKQFHGTYTWGIAGGSGSDNGLHKGIAYDATLVGATIPLGSLKDYGEEFKENAIQFIKSKLLDGLNVGGNISVDFSLALLLVELKCIFDQADALGMPCVVNWSLGASISYADDLSVENEILSSLLGPGHILVNSAGNNGQVMAYEKKEATDNSYRAFMEHANDQPGNFIFTIACAQSTPDFKITLLTPSDGDTIRVFTQDIDKAYREGMMYLDTITCVGKEKADGDYIIKAELSMSLHKEGQKCYWFSVTLPHYENNALNTYFQYIVLEVQDPVEFEIFTLPPLSLSDAGYVLSGMPYTLSWPSVVDDVISVGAMNLRERFMNTSGESYSYQVLRNKYGKIANFSSCGPTYDGRTKPDVVAPGHNIISAFDSFYEGYMSNSLKAYAVDVDGKEYAEYAFSGTSAAAPVVSGIVALWLQANPRLTSADILEIMKKTSSQEVLNYQHSTEKSNLYGWGVIDAYAGLLEILGIDNIPASISRHQPSDVIFTVNESRLGIVFTHNEKSEWGRINIFTTDGRLVLQTTIVGSSNIDLSRIQKGVYVVQLTTSNPRTTGSTLIRI